MFKCNKCGELLNISKNITEKVLSCVCGNKVNIHDVLQKSEDKTIDISDSNETIMQSNIIQEDETKYASSVQNAQDETIDASSEKVPYNSEETFLDTKNRTQNPDENETLLKSRDVSLSRSLSSSSIRDKSHIEYEQVGSERKLKHIGKYDIISEIGRGGMGIVYKAMDSSLKREVAIKILLSGEDASENTISRFQQESETVAKLSHPNIVEIHDIGIANNIYYFVMEYVSGEPLSNLLNDNLTVLEKLRIMEHVSQAISYCHDNNVLHRDLKPANILVLDNANPVVMDFGLAKVTDDQDSNLTRTGAILGTPSYMSPEQAESSKNIDGRTDIFALGIVLYELFTGVKPFTGDTSIEVLTKIIDEDPVHPKKINPKLKADICTVILKCLEKRPDMRYQTAEELSSDISALINQEPIKAKPPTIGRKINHWLKKHKLTAMLYLFIVLTGIGAILWIEYDNARQIDTQKALDEKLKQTRLIREKNLAVQEEMKEIEKRKKEEEKLAVLAAEKQKRYIEEKKNTIKLLSNYLADLNPEIKILSRIKTNELTELSSSPGGMEYMLSLLEKPNSINCFHALNYLRNTSSGRYADKAVEIFLKTDSKDVEYSAFLYIRRIKDFNENAIKMLNKEKGIFNDKVIGLIYFNLVNKNSLEYLMNLKLTNVNANTQKNKYFESYLRNLDNVNEKIADVKAYIEKLNNIAKKMSPRDFQWGAKSKISKDFRKMLFDTRKKISSLGRSYNARLIVLPFLLDIVKNDEYGLAYATLELIDKFRSYELFWDLYDLTKNKKNNNHDRIVKMLYRIGGKNAIPVLLDLFKYRNKENLVTVYGALAAIRDKDVIMPIFNQLKDQSSNEIRLEAINTLEILTKRSGGEEFNHYCNKVLGPKLVQFISHEKNSSIRQIAISVLGNLDYKEALPFLFSLLNQTIKYENEAVLKVIRKYSTLESVPLLIKELERIDYDERNKMNEIVLSIFKHAPNQLKDIISKNLKSDNRNEKLVAIKSIMLLKIEEYLPLVFDILENWDKDSRLAAASGLYKYRLSDQYYKKLIELLDKEKNWEVADRLLNKLCDNSSKENVKRLEYIVLNNKNQYHRTAVLFHLSRMRNYSMKEILLKIINKNDNNHFLLKDALKYCTYKYFPEYQEYALKHLKESKYSDVKMEAARVLLHGGSLKQEVIEKIIKSALEILKKEKDSNVKRVIINQLAEMKSNIALSFCIKEIALPYKKEYVVQLYQYIMEFGDRSHIPLFWEKALADPDFKVRIAGAQALANFKVKEAIPDIVGLFDNWKEDKYHEYDFLVKTNFYDKKIGEILYQMTGVDFKTNSGQWKNWLKNQNFEKKHE